MMTRIAVLALASVALAAAADVAGKWNMIATAPGGEEHKVVLELKNDGGKLTGKLSSEEGDFNLEDVQLKGDQLSYRLPVEGGYVLRFTVAGNTMKGTYTGSDGTTGPLSATRAAASGPSVSGTWKGTAKSTGGRQYNVQLDLASLDARITGTLTADEGSLPIQEAKLEGDRLTFKLTTDDGGYVVKLTVSGDTMKGDYTGPGGEAGSVAVKR